jgi:hypothetical protein
MKLFRHLDLLESGLLLASRLIGLEKMQLAAEILQQVVKIAKRDVGYHHPRMLATISQHASISTTLWQHKLAKRFLQRGLGV